MVIEFDRVVSSYLPGKNPVISVPLVNGSNSLPEDSKVELLDLYIDGRLEMARFYFNQSGRVIKYLYPQIVGRHDDQIK